MPGKLYLHMMLVFGYAYKHGKEAAQTLLNFYAMGAWFFEMLSGIDHLSCHLDQHCSFLKFMVAFVGSSLMGALHKLTIM